MDQTALFDPTKLQMGYICELKKLVLLDFRIFKSLFLLMHSSTNSDTF